MPWASAFDVLPAWAHCISTTASRACGYSKGGLSSISVGGRGALFNIPFARSGGARTTVGVPGTGLSWGVEHSPDRSASIPVEPAAGLPYSRRLRLGRVDALKQSRWPIF